LLLFFGWEGVGLVSYLLIGFWFTKETANFAALKAFIANRVGDLGFLLGVAAVLMYYGTLDYSSVFAATPALAAKHLTISLWPGTHWSVITVICLFLFVGAIGKSAQIPLHMWLEGSMEGPTPISALIHAATMVTAGVFMLARLSPMFECSTVSLSVVLIIGSATCFFMGILGTVQMDIKRVIAYSTLSQLGYMMAAQGASAFPIGMFHLMSHAAFKALLFLAAGSVIIAMHHKQDLGEMGGLRKFMPITYVCMLIGALALAAIPPFSGFFSKDLIIEAVQMSTIPGHKIASFFVVGGAFITAVYTFRMFFLTFHGKMRMDENVKAHVKESPWQVWLPLVCLAVPALGVGYVFFEPALHGFFGHAIYIAPQHNVVAALAAEYPTPLSFVKHAVFTLPFWLAIGGVVLMWIFYGLYPAIPEWIKTNFKFFHTFLVHKYFVDGPIDVVFCWVSQSLGKLFWKVGDHIIIDQIAVEGSAKTTRFAGRMLRKIQTGHLSHYALLMMVGVLVLLGWVFLTVGR
jgi:NADH-quinone oxidoreductase subunit L